ncbi:sushi, von Willebrand factor type A, EGF and pentraxin domain-containing protein 1-like [Sycon ciliatum]|uniref:sushi, von Willebrand factor type A, EGF and pentraxin domain-containing protein 1-like n=1 Tax=Sycon ciliatum TaxID=27933 RepID=UPI0031F5FEFA
MSYFSTSIMDLHPLKTLPTPGNAMDSITFQSCLITSVPEGTFSKFPQLTELTLRVNKIVTIWPGAFNNVPKLTKLVLDHNPLSFLPDNVFANLTSLDHLDLSNNELTTLSLQMFTGANLKLSTLELHDNKFAFVQDELLDSIRKLTIQNTPFEGAIKSRSHVNKTLVCNDLTSTLRSWKGGYLCQCPKGEQPYVTLSTTSTPGASQPDTGTCMPASGRCKAATVTLSNICDLYPTLNVSTAYARLTTATQYPEKYFYACKGERHLVKNPCYGQAMDYVQKTCNPQTTAYLCVCNETDLSTFCQSTIKSCTDPGTPENGTRSSLPRLDFGTVANFSCNTGYTLRGNVSITCTSQGWSAPVPNCDLCADLGAPANGSRTLEGGDVNETVTYTCDKGFTLVGEPDATCTRQGNWTSSLPTCKVVTCEDPGTPRNGSRKVDRTEYNGTVVYNCDEGFALVGQGVAVCMEDGNWTSLTPTCVGVVCPSPGTPTDGSQDLDGLEYQDSATYSCDTGFSLVGQTTAVCTQHGNWSSQVPTCKGVVCPSPGTPTDGSQDLDGLEYQDSATYSCDTGFSLVGQTTAVCTQHGNWSSQVPTCKGVVCPSPGTPTDGSQDLDGLEYQDSATYSCDTGFSLVGQTTAVCTQHGNWSSQVPTCKGVVCKNPSMLTNGTRTLEGLQYNETVTYSCDKGFSLVGQPTAVCTQHGNWSSQAPTCKVVPCLSDPGTPQNGLKRPHTSVYLSVVTYACSKDYNLIGSSSRTCMEDGAWSPKLPKCEIKKCIDLGVPQNGRRVLEGLAIRSKVAHFCDVGYTIIGSAFSTCYENQTWSTPLPTCRIVDCADPGTPADGSRTLTNGFVYDSSVRYHCKPGLKLTGSEVARCTENGKWTYATPPKCKPITCVDPGTPMNGSRMLEGLAYNNTVTFSCGTGFNLTGAAVRRCSDTGKWSSAQPTCQAITCPDQVAPGNGSRMTTGLAYNATVRYSCDAGFDLNGTVDGICAVTGRWSSPRPRCDIVSCPDPGSPVNGSRTLNSLHYNSVAVYRCDIGYHMSGSMTSQCLANKTWSAAVPACKIVQCPDAGIPKHGSRQPHTSVYQSVVRYECGVGYNMSGSLTRTCTENATWTPAIPTCIKINCPTLRAPQNGGMKVSGIETGSTGTFTCSAGYNLIGVSSIQCSSTGQWSGSVPHCKIVQCPDPGTPAHGTKQPHTLTYQSSVRYDCDAGYYLVGSSSRTCTQHGQWTSTLPTCKTQHCPNPGTPGNGIQLLQGLSYLSIVAYKCNLGYNLNGSTFRVCSADKTWTPAMPICQISECSDPGTPENATRQLDGLSYGDQVLYSCLSGFSLNGSESRTCTEYGNWSASAPHCEGASVLVGASDSDSTAAVATGVTISTLLLVFMAIFLGFHHYRPDKLRTAKGQISSLARTTGAHTKPSRTKLSLAGSTCDIYMTERRETAVEILSSSTSTVEVDCSSIQRHYMNERQVSAMKNGIVMDNTNYSNTHSTFGSANTGEDKDAAGYFNREMVPEEDIYGNDADSRKEEDDAGNRPYDDSEDIYGHVPDEADVTTVTITRNNSTATGRPNFGKNPDEYNAFSTPAQNEDDYEAPTEKLRSAIRSRSGSVLHLSTLPKSGMCLQRARTESSASELQISSTSSVHNVAEFSSSSVTNASSRRNSFSQFNSLPDPRGVRTNTSSSRVDLPQLPQDVKRPASQQISSGSTSARGSLSLAQVASINSVGDDLYGSITDTREAFSRQTSVFHVPLSADVSRSPTAPTNDHFLLSRYSSRAAYRDSNGQDEDDYTLDVDSAAVRSRAAVAASRRVSDLSAASRPQPAQAKHLMAMHRPYTAI